MPGPQSFTLNGGGGSLGGSDAIYFASQRLGGDGEIVAQLKTLQLYWGNRAGVMIRESLAPTARYVALVGRPSESRRVNDSGVNEGVELWVKDQTGGEAPCRGQPRSETAQLAEARENGSAFRRLRFC